jgi:3-mercaptopyruvate sulfurtransferase SseA
MRKLSLMFMASLFVFTILLSCKGEAKSSVQQVAANSQTKPVQKTKPIIKALSVDAFKAAIEKEGAQLVDVRTPREFAQSHIENAINVNFSNPSFSF